MHHTENTMQKRCGQCLKHLNPGPKLRRLNSVFLLCDSCGESESRKGRLMVRQYGWEESCMVCLEDESSIVFFACCTNASTTLVGHTLCFTCSERLELRRSGVSSVLVFPEDPVVCPCCKGEVIYAVQAASEVVVLDEPEIKEIIRVVLTEGGRRRVKVRLSNSDEMWMNLHDLQDTEWRVRAQIIFEDEYGV
ncbi:uncharacterized protein FMAN_15477 [Fusarium mangiferae]|uniref:Uncharacterized protein n=1 Tax=Fusarium mangiferae TaxID=192010 RepID=A0A1L7UP56_FUSMA|nr:uncharacterized protein FMAN_15477 [Fusarium mangiferae]CVL09311.1 uncharacterized protein FMAN_15477 [Fusarium mangiferae]